MTLVNRSKSASLVLTLAFQSLLPLARGSEPVPALFTILLCVYNKMPSRTAHFKHLHLAVRNADSYWVQLVMLDNQRIQFMQDSTLRYRPACSPLNASKYQYNIQYSREKKELCDISVFLFIFSTTELSWWETHLTIIFIYYLLWRASLEYNNYLRGGLIEKNF